MKIKNSEYLEEYEFPFYWNDLIKIKEKHTDPDIRKISNMYLNELNPDNNKSISKKEINDFISEYINHVL